MEERSSPAYTVGQYQILQLNEYTATAAFIVTLWDTVVTFEDEITYIWPKPNRAYIKWLYLFGKYLTLVMQIGFYWFQVDVIPHNSVPERWCRTYRVLQASLIELLLLVFDCVLLIRIYAFYGQKTIAAVLGGCAVLLECVAAVSAAILTFPGMTYEADCTVINFPESVLLVAIGTFVSQTTLLWLAYRKRRAILLAEQNRTSIASVTIRDGIIAFVCIITVFVAFAICELVNSSDTNLAIYWLPVFISIATCRVIMNIQQASSPEASGYELSTQLWTDYEMQSFSTASDP